MNIKDIINKLSSNSNQVSLKDIVGLDINKCKLLFKLVEDTMNKDMDTFIDIFNSLVNQVDSAPLDSEISLNTRESMVLGIVFYIGMTRYNDKVDKLLSIIKNKNN